jgi:hypothetical protein
MRSPRGSSARRRHDHDLLEVQRVVRVGSAVNDVHHRHGERARVHAADVAPQRNPRRFRPRARDRERNAQDGVRPEPALVGRAVQADQQGVDPSLVLRLEPGEDVEDLAVHRVHGLAHALAAVTALVAVALLDRLVRAGGRARGHGRAAQAAVFQHHIHLDGRVAAAVQHLAADDVDDFGHALSPEVAARRT